MKTNIPKEIICATGEVTIAVARYLENEGFALDANLTRRNQDPIKDSFFTEGQENVISIHNGRASWCSSRCSSGKGFKTLREFVKSIKGPSWKIGCRTISVKGNELLIEKDNITVPKSTLEEMLASLE